MERRNLRELSCSTVLFDRYRGLHALLASHTRVAPGRLARVRAHYEETLLGLLRGPAGQFADACTRLDACLAELRGHDP